MNPMRLLIADPDVQFTQRLSAHLRGFPDIDLISIEDNGLDALRKVRSQRPDLLLFDLILPGLDGISLLRSVNELRQPPATVCCTRFFSEVSLEAVRDFGASFVLFKPLEITSLHGTLAACFEMHRRLFALRRQSASDDDGEVLCAQIRNYVVSLGIPSKMIGCSYLAEAVRLARDDVSLTRNLSRGIYLEISRSMNTTPSRIERCIRSAISAAYMTGGLNSRMNACPSNKEFINYILRNMDL